TDAVVQLPPMLVEESSKSPPWFYALAGDSEYLSRCSRDVTDDYIKAQLTIHALLRTIVPDEFLAKNAIPHVSICVPPSATPGDNDAVYRSMMDTEQEYQRSRTAKAVIEGRVPTATRFQFMPNLRLD